MFNWLWLQLFLFSSDASKLQSPGPHSKISNNNESLQSINPPSMVISETDIPSGGNRNNTCIEEKRQNFDLRVASFHEIEVEVGRWPFWNFAKIKVIKPFFLYLLLSVIKASSPHIVFLTTM